jgi:hypothetical protein
MGEQNKDPLKSPQPTMCVVCAGRVAGKKKYSYEQGSVIKCPDFTRDLAQPGDDEDQA